MNCRVVFLAIVCCCLTATAFAQNSSESSKKKSSVYGIVTDAKSGSPIEFATAVLLRVADSTAVNSTITDKNGRFSLGDIPPGDYKLKLVFMGYSDTEKPVKVTAGAEVDTHTSTLQPVENVLSEARITAKVERKIDKLVMTVEGATSTEGNNALEVLKKAPGVTVDHDGNIKLLGGNVLVQVDGRNTYLSSADLSALLSSMDASEISKIEIINSPSSSQDASGSSGIINIRTRKSVLSGINGNVNAGFTAAEHWGYNGGLRLNYRSEKLGAFGSYSYRSGENFNTIDHVRNYHQATPPSVYQSFSDSRFKRDGGNYRFGLDFYLNPKNTLGLIATGNHGNDKGTSIASTTNTINTGLESRSETSNLRNTSSNSMTLNANYRKLFDKEGQQLTFDADYARFNNKQTEDRDNHFFNLITNRDSTLLIHTYSPRKVEVYSGKADYVQPLGKTAQLEAGAKISYSKTNSELDWKNNHSGTWEPDSNRSNEFEYSERVTAAYLSWGKQLNEKLSVKAGLRWENTWSKGYSPTTGGETVQNYNDIFPTVFLNYKPWKNHDFSLTYNRRIQRPDYDALNPFRMYIDAYTYVAGNADLKPQYTDNLSLSHGFKNMIITSLFYQRQSDLIIQTPEQSDQLGESGVIQDNFGYNNMLGLNISIPAIPVTKWWIVTANLWGGWSHSHSKQNDVVYDDYRVMGSGYLSCIFTFAKSWRAEASLNATSPMGWGYFKIEAQYYNSFGIKKSFLDNKLNLSINIDDPFKLSKNSMDVKYDKYDYHYETRWMSQRIRVGLTWRFGSTKLKPVQERKGGNTEELSRIKTE